MKLNVIKNEKNYLEIEFLDQDMAFVNTIASIALENKDVEFCAAKLDHPEVSNPVLIIRTKSSSPKKVLIEAAQELKEQIKKLQEGLKK
ncbi:MAG: DNA-directed RNA polymerase subunit L [Candidatus Anstonellaceae archaeon]